MVSLRNLAQRIDRHFQTRQAYKFFIKDWTGLDDLHAAAPLLGTMRFSRNLQPVIMDHPQAKRIAVLAPHPDDEVLGAGGTLVKSIAARIPVSTIYVTTGKPADQMESEARQVAERIGFDTDFLKFELNRIALDRPSLETCAAALKRIGPDCIFLPFLLDDHDDHRRVSELLLRMWQEGLFDPEGVEIWGYQVYTTLPPNVVIDITETIKHKASAMRCYTSQMQRRDWAHYILGLNAFMSRFLPGSKSPCYAEAFFVVPAKSYLELCEIYFRNPGKTYYTPFYLDGAL
ncbi:PIG-L family deacetylase [Ferrovibrio sp.]|uniref:PIG-L deacetylase family protein n=1 Tax=Ferrovibrio sp. TaxID=1917215 RepID=UPI000CAA185A|nr:PIG-L family deacetylase [Ferrovibrio sp.]PJI41888.1 MAG: hypothetical protein CTR53_05360 [Ferrovibrio sp.]